MALFRCGGGKNTSGVFYLKAPSRVDVANTFMTLDAGDYVAIYTANANASTMNIVSPNDMITITDAQARVQIRNNLYYKIIYFTAQQGATVAGNISTYESELIVIPQ